ncbi:MAG: thioredoxin family protein, partial [Bacteroidota bacterium]
MLKFWLPGLVFLLSLGLLAWAKGPELVSPNPQIFAASETNGDPDTLELGAVHWRRDFDQALMAAQQSGKPVFILFQEVPGCLNCQRFGKEVMSHPLIVDAIEEAFV